MLTSLSDLFPVQNPSSWDAALTHSKDLSSPIHFNLHNPLWDYPKAGFVGDPRSCQVDNQYLPSYMSFILFSELIAVR